MAARDDCFQEFLHPLVHESMAKNEQFEKSYGRHERWDWDDDASTLTFSDSGEPKLRIQASVVGTTEGSSWEWSWANKNIKPETKLEIEKVRGFGEANGFEKLTSAFLQADEYTGWEMTAIAVHILQAPGSYRFPTDHGFCYLVYRKIEEVGDLHGAMCGTVELNPDVDLTDPTGEVWDAESETSS